MLGFVARDAEGAVDTDRDVIGRRATISGTATFTTVPVEPGMRLDYAHAYQRPQLFALCDGVGV